MWYIHRDGVVNMIPESTEVRDYILKNREMFEDVQDARKKNSGTSRVGEHSVLNYPKILDDMIKYLKGFKDYKGSGSKTYKHRVIQSTYNFYNSMFDSNENGKYRKKITLSEFPNMNYKFIEKSKELHQLIQDMKKSVDNETLNLVRVTEKQYKKIAKVNRDDMVLYMWLASDLVCPANVRSFYGDPSTPVMHKTKGRD